MDDIGQGKFGGPFPDFFGDLLKMLNTGSPIQWELAVQLAESVANAGFDSGSDEVEPVDRIRLEELYPIAELHVSDIMGMDTRGGHKPLAISTVNRSRWIRTNISSWKPLLEKIAQAIIATETLESEDVSSVQTEDVALAPNSETDDHRDKSPEQTSLKNQDSENTATNKEGLNLDGLDLEGLGLSDLANIPFDLSMLSGEERSTLSADEENSVSEESNDQWPLMLSQWAQVIAPTMLAMQIGSIMGRLARYCLGGYDFPLPKENSNEIVLIPQNIKKFSSDWSIPLAECEIYIAAGDIALQAILSRDHIRDYLTNLLVSYAQHINPDPSVLEERIRGLSQFDIPHMTQIMSDPTIFDESRGSDKLLRIKKEIETFTAVLLGYADWVSDAASKRLIANNTAIKEALKRRRVERGPDERAAENFFGLNLTQDILEKGSAFISGVLERGGESELAALWTKKEFLPTSNEVEAPGLWLERIRLDIDL